MKFLIPFEIKVEMALTTSFYDYPKVSSLFAERIGVMKKRLWQTDDEKCNPLICHVYESSSVCSVSVPVFANLSDDACKILYALGDDSPVGKGKETVIDKKVRSSKELTGTTIKWSSEFLNYCASKVDVMVQKMNAGTLKELKPHKIIIYGPGDFFAEHMDSTHTPGQNMTAVVELATSWDTDDLGGEEWGLRVGDKKFRTEEDEINLFVFDHDIPHEVNRISAGYRVSITFDLIVDPLVNEKIVLSDMVEKIKKLGAKRFGFFGTHRYMGDQALKGVDIRLVELLKPFAKRIERLNLSTDDTRNWYHPKVWELKNSAPGVSELMYEVDDYSEEEDVYHGNDYEAPSGLPKSKFPSEWKPADDELTELINPKYCLNDVFCLWTPYKPRHSMMANDEIHLGNEGFYGDIHDCTFLLFELE